MSGWLSHSTLMRPEIPDWLEEIGQKLKNNDPRLTTLELTHHRIDNSQARFLAECLKGNTIVQFLLLSCYCLVDDDALALASVIRSSKTIKRVQLRDVRHSRELLAFFKSLSSNQQLEELSIRHSRIDLQSSKTLGILLETHSCLKELRIVDTQLLGNSLSHICRGIQGNPGLRRLYLVNTGISSVDGGRCVGNMLRRNRSLQELYLGENALGDEGAMHLSDGLVENKDLKSIDLRSNEIGVEGALSLAALVRRSNTMIGLYIGMNEIGDAGVEALAAGLATGKLKKLDLSDNGIGPFGAQAISDMLRTNTSLHELNLSFNAIGDDGASCIANVLDVNSTLHCLSLRRNYIKDAGAYVFAEKLPYMRGLKELSMIRNNIGQDGITSLLNGIRRNMELVYLHVDDKVSEPAVREIVHWIRLNIAGRSILRNVNLPVALWPDVLSNFKINADIDVLYHFLTEKPDMFQHSRKRKAPTI